MRAPFFFPAWPDAPWRRNAPARQAPAITRIGTATWRTAGAIAALARTRARPARRAGMARRYTRRSDTRPGPARPARPSRRQPGPLALRPCPQASTRRRPCRKAGVRRVCPAGRFGRRGGGGPRTRPLRASTPLGRDALKAKRHADILARPKAQRRFQLRRNVMAIRRSAALAPPRRGAAGTPGTGLQRPVRARWPIPARRKPPARHRPPFGCAGALPMYKRRVNPMLPPAQHRVAPGVAITEMPVERPFRHAKSARHRLDPESGGAPRHQCRHPRRDPVFPPELPHQAHIRPFRSRAARPFAPSCPERPCNKVNRIAATGPCGEAANHRCGPSTGTAHPPVWPKLPYGPNCRMAPSPRWTRHHRSAVVGKFRGADRLPRAPPPGWRCRPPATPPTTIPLAANIAAAGPDETANPLKFPCNA